MKRTHLIGVLVGVITIGIFAADASAFYHPTMGTWMQRIRLAQIQRLPHAISLCRSDITLAQRLS